jgi:hypothetical protein
MMPRRYFRSEAGKFVAVRRLGVIALTAVLGVALLVGGSHIIFDLNGQALSTYAHAAQSIQPRSFADIVERVKPGVIAACVKVENDVTSELVFPFEPGSPLDRFFRKFVFPDGIPLYRFSRPANAWSS